MAKKPEENYNSDLGFKYHTQEFLDVSQELRQVAHIGRLAKKQVGLVNDFYDGIEYLDEIYSEYFTNKEKIDEIFKFAEKKINDDKYKKDLERYNKGDTKLEKSLKEYEHKIIKSLKKVLKLISSDLVKSELRPRPNQKEKEKFSDIDNETVRKIFKSADQIIKK